MRSFTFPPLMALVLASGCFIDRSGSQMLVAPDAGRDAGTRLDAGRADAGRDAGPPDASRPPLDAACAPGTVDVDMDPANGCECTIASPPTEFCNGRDDDCDPSTFDGQDERLLFMACDGADADRCADGAWVCNLGALACTDPLEDTFEMCGNAIDEDCDGASDESTAIDATIWYRDADSDGYGAPGSPVSACVMPPGYVASSDDCDDTSDARSPGAVESCNGRDDDCSGFADDSGCPCIVRHFGAAPYMFCAVAANWDAARGFCAGFGYRLVKVETMAENAWISSTASSIGPGGWWIGLRQGSGGWDWTDGSRAGYSAWASGQPDDGSSITVTEDCVEINAIAGDRWNDYRCERGRPFVCEWP